MPMPIAGRMYRCWQPSPWSGGGVTRGLPNRARTAAGLLDLVDFATDFAELHIASVMTAEPVNHPEHYGTVAFSGRAAESA